MMIRAVLARPESVTEHQRFCSICQLIPLLAKLRNNLSVRLSGQSSLYARMQFMEQGTANRASMLRSWTTRPSRLQATLPPSAR